MNLRRSRQEIRQRNKHLKVLESISNFKKKKKKFYLDLYGSIHPAPAETDQESQPEDCRKVNPSCKVCVHVFMLAVQDNQPEQEISRLKHNAQHRMPLC